MIRILRPARQAKGYADRIPASLHFKLKHYTFLVLIVNWFYRNLGPFLNLLPIPKTCGLIKRNESKTNPWGQTLPGANISFNKCLHAATLSSVHSCFNKFLAIQQKLCIESNKKKDELDYRVETFFRLLGSLALWKAGIIVICSHFVIIWLSLPLSLKRKKPLHFISQASVLLSQRKWWTFGDSDAVTDKSISCNVKLFFFSAFENLLYF